MNMVLLTLMGMLGFTNCGHFRKVSPQASYYEPVVEDKYGIPMPDEPDDPEPASAPLPKKSK